MEFENNNNEEDANFSSNDEKEEDLEEIEECPSPESLLNQELFKHPIFLQKSDELLSTLIQPLNSILQGSAAQIFPVSPLEMNIFKGKMYNLTFGNKKISELSEFKGFNLSNKTTCGKHITMNEVYFRCVDCDIMTHPDFHALLCMNCFEKSNHKNHRVLRVQKLNPGAATCDCGDDEAFNPQGFCPDHQPKAINIEELLAKFPNEILNNYQAVLKKGLYGAVSIFEIADRCEGRKIYRAVKSLAEKAMEKLLDFWSLCYTEINESFLPILSITLKSQFEDPYHKVWHDCEDMKAEIDMKSVDIEQERECSCTVLGNLFRLGIKMDPESQSKLEKMLVECVKDSEFREYVAIEFTRYNHFFYNYKTENDSHEVNNQSRLLRMQMQLYQKEESLVKILELGHFPNFVSVIQKAISSAQTANYDLYHIVADIRSAIIYFLVPAYKTSGQVIKSDLIKEFLDIYMDFQMEFYYEGRVYVGLFEHLVNYRSINRGLMIEKVLCQPVESCINLIRNFPQEEKAKLYGEIVKQWYKSFEVAKSVRDDEIKEGKVSFHPCLERLFCCLVRNCLGEIVTVGGLESFFKQNMPEQNMNEVAEKVIEGVLRALGMVRYIHLIHNFRYGKIWHVYYYFYNAFFEVDVALVQMMMSLTRPEALFESLVKNFFSYAPDLIRLFTEEMKLPVNQDYLKQQLTVAEDFLNFLICLTNDEICLLNLDTRYMKYSYNDIKSDSRYLRVTEKATKNVMLGSYWTTLVNVKAELENVFLQQQNVDEMIQKLTVLSEKDHKIRIKDEYQEDFDPYIFYRFPSFQQNVTNSMTTKAQQDKKVDLVSGQYYKDLPQYLKNNQMTLFQSNLSNFLSVFIRKFNDILSPLMRPVLKLILLNLQVLDDLFKNGKEEEENTIILRKKMEENYLVNEFTNGLNAIMMKDTYKECEPCIQKIQGLLKSLSEKLEKKKDVIEDEELLNKSKDVEEKKRMAKERMAKLKENFAKKQEMFAEKNSALLAQSKASEETKDTEDAFAIADGANTCQYCIEPILENEEEFVTPIYINFTNNFYDTEAENVFKKQENYADMCKANWWPVVTNCNHQYHKKCYEEVFKSSAMKIGNFVTNKYEAYCPLCKTLTNSFLSLNKKKVEDAEPPSTHIKLHFPELYKSFTDKIVGLVAELQKKLLVNSLPIQAVEEEKEKNDERIVRISFERAYGYFIEGFYLQNRPKDLKKQFVLYKNFFKGFQDFFGGDFEIIPGSQTQKSLFKEISQIDGDTNKLLSYQPEPLVNQLFISVLQEILSNSIQDEEPLWNSQLTILQEYIVFKIIQGIALLQLDKSMSLQDCLSFYRTNSELQAKISSQIIFPIQKIILASWLNFSVGFDDLPRTSNEFYQVLLEEERPSDNGEYLSQLLSQVGISVSFDQFVQDSFAAILAKSSEEDLCTLNDLVTAKTPELEFEALRTVKYGPRSVKLQENYAQFNDKYFVEKCHLCEKYSPHLLTSICLICGEIMCEMYCDPLTKVSGNLNRHAKKYHMGMGIFIDMVKLGGRLVNAPLNLRYKEQEPYIDNFGQSFNSVLDSHQKLKDFDFAKFVLNPKYVEEIDQMIRLQSIRQTIFKIGLKLNQKSQNGYL